MSISLRTFLRPVVARTLRRASRMSEAARQTIGTWLRDPEACGGWPRAAAYKFEFRAGSVPYDFLLPDLLNPSQDSFDCCLFSSSSDSSSDDSVVVVGTKASELAFAEGFRCCLSTSSALAFLDCDLRSPRLCLKRDLILFDHRPNVFCPGYSGASGSTYTTKPSLFAPNSDPSSNSFQYLCLVGVSSCVASWGMSGSLNIRFRFSRGFGCSPF